MKISFIRISQPRSVAITSHI